MEYKTGQRFTAKIQGTPVEGKIYVVEQDDVYLCQNKMKGVVAPDRLGYNYSWCCNPSNLPSFITDLELLPDTDEPVKGDLVEVSDDNTDWTAKPRIYTGYQEEDGHYLTDLGGSYASWKHIRKAPSPEQARREEAEKEAREFCLSRGHDTVPAILEALTEYIYKLKTEGK